MKINKKVNTTFFVHSAAYSVHMYPSLSKTPERQDRGIQWNLSNLDTTGAETVSLLVRCRVPFRGVSSFQGTLIERFHFIPNVTMTQPITVCMHPWFRACSSCGIGSASREHSTVCTVITLPLINHNRGTHLSLDGKGISAYHVVYVCK